MKTSRIARETAKITSQLSHTDFAPRRQTRSFAASLSATTPNDVYLKDSGQELDVKKEDLSDDDSSLSSAASTSSVDIEDAPFSAQASRKRKRRNGTPSTTMTSLSAAQTARNSPPELKTERDDSKTTSKKRARRQPAKKPVSKSGEVEIHPPANWDEIYAAVKEMRSRILAPVDTMGCETLAEENITPRDKRFQTLTALMLSSQTKDTTTALAIQRLQTSLPGHPPGLTLENVLAVDPVFLNELIFIVGFHNNKTRYLKATALILRDNFSSDIPSTIEGLMSLPGVGPKMAYLCLSAAWGRTEGIGVDVHVHRITNLWGWHKTRGPEETRRALEGWLPREKWHEINHLLVGFGQTVCLPVGRKCGECTLSSRGLCPSAVVEKKKVRRKKVVKEDEGGDGKVEEAVKEEMIKREVMKEGVTKDEGVKERVMKEEVMMEEATKDEVMKDEVMEGMRGEVMKEEVMMEEATKEEVTQSKVMKGVKEEVMKEDEGGDGRVEDAIKEEVMKQEVMKEDAMKEDAMKEMKGEVMEEEMNKEKVIKEEAVKEERPKDELVKQAGLKPEENDNDPKAEEPTMVKAEVSAIKPEF